MPLALDLIDLVLPLILPLLHRHLIMTNELSVLVVFALTFYSERLHYISFLGVVIDDKIIILDQFHPSTLSQVKLPL